MPRLMLELLPFTPRSAAVEACLLFVPYNLHLCCKHQKTTKSGLGTEALIILQSFISLGLRVEAIGVLLVRCDSKRRKEGRSGFLNLNRDFRGSEGSMLYSFD